MDGSGPFTLHIDHHSNKETASIAVGKRSGFLGQSLRTQYNRARRINRQHRDILGKLPRRLPSEVSAEVRFLKHSCDSTLIKRYGERRLDFLDCRVQRAH